MKKKKLIILIGLCVVFAILLTLALLGKFTWGWFDEKEEEETPPLELEEGEAYYYIGSVMREDIVAAFPQVDRKDMFLLRVENTSGSNYFFQQANPGTTSAYFSLGKYVTTTNDDGETVEVAQHHRPPITEIIQDFDYTTLYDDTESISSLIVSTGGLRISERIKPKEGDIVDGKLTQEFLARYGLSAADKPAVITIIPYAWDLRDNGQYYYTYEVDEDEEVYPILRLDNGKYYYIESKDDVDAPVSELTEYTGTKKPFPAADKDNPVIYYVGNNTIDDNGCYVYVQGRNVVYAVSSSNLTTIAQVDIGYYVSPRLVTAADTAASHLLTPGFSIENGTFVDSIGAQIDRDATVAVTVEEIMTKNSNGGTATDYDWGKFLQIDLTDPGDLTKLAEAIGTATVGDQVDAILPQPALTESGDIVTYRMKHLVGVLRNAKYSEDAGTVITDTDKVVITYSDGGLDAQGGQVTYYGYVDLEKAPEGLKTLLVGKAVGDDLSGDEWTFTYDGHGHGMYHFTYEITNINSILNSDGSSLPYVTYGSTVTVTYTIYEDGEKVGVDRVMSITLPEAGEEEEQYDHPDTWYNLVYSGDRQNAKRLAYIYKTIADALMDAESGSCLDDAGESKYKIDIAFAVEHIEDYKLYKNAKIDYAVSYEEKLSFAFKNNRDIYYGGSLYEIDPTTDKSMYALDTSATEEVLALFEDLSGDSTVAIGLDAATMEEYSLYDYRLTFTMPFDIYSETRGETDYYFYNDKITYTLYISRIQKDGSRYLASDQYDNVVKIEDGSLFDFVDWSFYTKWMQNSLLSVTYENLRRMVFDLNFDDGGDYDRVWAYDITVDPNYQYPTYYTDKNGEHQVKYETGARLYAALVNVGSTLGQTNGKLSYDALNALLAYEESSYNQKTDTPHSTLAGKFVYAVRDDLTNIKELQAGTFTDLDAIYGNRFPASGNGVDMMGSENMRSILQLLLSMRYWGEVTDDLSETEIKELCAGEYSMRLALTLWDTQALKECGYTLTFYNYGSHSLVVLGDEQRENESALFYIQTREVRKLAKAVVALGTGVDIDLDNY